MSTEFTVVHTRAPSDWEPWDADNVTVTDTGVELCREPAPTYITPTVVGTGAHVEMVDVDVDRCGTHYALDTGGALYRATAADSSFERLPCDGLDVGIDDATPKALCITDETFYVVGGPASADESGGAGSRSESDAEPSRSAYVQGLSVQLRQTRWVIETVGGVPLRDPLRAVRGPDDECYVLDGGRGEASGFVARVGTDGRASVVAEGLREPRDLTVDDEGTLTVLCLERVSPCGDSDENEASDDATDEEVEKLVLESYPTVSARFECRCEDADGGDEEVGSHETTHEQEQETATDGEETKSEETGCQERTGLCVPIQNATSIEAIAPGEFVVGVGPRAERKRRTVQKRTDTESTLETEQILYRYTAGATSAEPLSSFKHSCRTLRRGYSTAAGPKLFAIDDDPAADGKAIDGSGNVYVLEPTDSFVAVPEGYVGRLTTRFDLGARGAEWYRVTLSVGEQPPGTRVSLKYATTDRDLGPDGPADPGAEPDDCRARGRDDDGDDDGVVRWRAGDESNPHTVLVRSYGRRFLWLRVELVGGQYVSPTVESLKLSLTHESYIEYLPAIYAEDRTGPLFLERFLNVFEDTFGDIDHGIETLTEYLAPDTIPASHLSWLGSWLAVAEDDAWASASKETLITEAPTLFKRRGTRRGLARLVDIYLTGIESAPPSWAAVTDGEAREDEPGDSDGQSNETDNGTSGEETDADTDRHGDENTKRENEGKQNDTEHGDEREDERGARSGHLVALVEYDAVVSPTKRESTKTETDGVTVCAERPGVAGDDAAMEDNDLPAPFSDLLCCPQEFLVVLAPTVGEEARATVERIVERERPAHTVGRTVTLSSWGRFGRHTYLGVNSYLPPDEWVVNESRLGWNSVVGAREPGSQLDDGWHARLDEGLELV